jgi:rod shape-determining protein MreC
LRGSWASLQNLKEENLSLQEKVRKLSRERLSFRDLKRENRRLRRLLGFKDASSNKLLPAQVIGRDTMHWYSSIIIDKGLRDGVAPGMVVVSEEGVIGKVIEVTPSISKVLLVVDKQSRIGGIVQRTRGMGIIEGTSFNTCRLNYLSRQSEAQAGDKVLTSGLGGVYPKGLYIGEIIKVHEGEYGLYKYADILPGVDFAKLEEVLVLVEKREEEGDYLK